MTTTTPLDQLPVTALKGAGPQLAERLQRLGITTVQDCLFHLPHRYQDRTRVVAIRDLRPGMEVGVVAESRGAEVRLGRRRSLLARVEDAGGALGVRLFHFSPAQRELLARGQALHLFGEVRRGPHGLEMVHPEMRRVTPGAPLPVADHLTPIYPATEGVQQPTLRRLVDGALGLLEAAPERLPEGLPQAWLTQWRLPALVEALVTLHHPPPALTFAQLEEPEFAPRRRLALEELLAHHLSMRQLRARMQRRQAPRLLGDGHLRQALRGDLPFTLTAAQERVGEEVAQELERPHPMQRMVQGDVGSGKTVVAALAVLQAVEAGYQAAVMAPTELLAEQHYRSFSAWLEPLGIAVAWLAGKRKGRLRQTAMAAIADGTPVVVGTHALFQESVAFPRLGLVVVDEQHRFGVHQRLALREKGQAEDGSLPHQLIMTATPIPRSLAMTAYADLDLSVIDSLPPGRTPVATVVVPDSRRDEVIARVEAACGEGRQAYWVCTLVEDSEALQAQAAEATAERLRAELGSLRVGLVHGRMKGAEKEAAMAAFKAGAVELLVATTVIEVGVDVPNASLMVIENAERLGLAQLHQLRGRVGRGATRSSCVLMYHPPLSDNARERLAILRDSNSGFEIAQRDLELRGPGEVLGTRQTGSLQFRVADLARDRALLPHLSGWSDTLLQAHPELVAPLIARWLGERHRYGEV